MSSRPGLTRVSNRGRSSNQATYDRWGSKGRALYARPAPYLLMLTTETALSDLEQRLRTAGFARAAPDLERFVAVWHLWLREPVRDMDPADDGDMVLYEASLQLREPEPYEYEPEPPRFSIEVTRQFSHVDGHGEYLGMEAISAAFVYEPHPDFRAITTMAEWSDDFGTADQFWGLPVDGADAWNERVRATRSFRTACGHRARRFILDQGDI